MKNNISIIGIGKLGICFGLTLEKNGFDVVGVDINQSYVDLINTKKLTSSEKGVVSHLHESKNFAATTNLEKALNHSDMIFVIVATPSLENGKYDHTQIINVVGKLKEFGRQPSHKHIVICCTTMPGFSDVIAKDLKPLNYTVSYNPEFIAQGTILQDQSYPDLTLIGEGSEEAGDRLQEIYTRLVKSDAPVHRMSRTSAELCKLSLNCFCTTKISFANMIGDLAVKVGAQPNKILNAVGADSRVGHKYLNYGFGYGGPCFPRDNRALAIFADEQKMRAHISLATDRINNEHLRFQISKFMEENDKEEPIYFDGSGESFNGSTVFEGVTYKRGTTIIEESQQLAFAAGLAECGYDVTIIDQQPTIEQVRGIYGELFTYEEVIF